MALCSHIVEHCIICLAILFVTSVSVGKAKRRARYSHDVSDYEVLIPRKVDASGAFQSFDVPHYYNLEDVRSRRSTATEAIHVRYVLPFGGREHMVELWPNHGFLSPGLVSERRQRDLWRASDMKHAFDKQCHYVGRVYGTPVSHAAISACHEGIAGFVKINNDQFFVEPVAEAHPDEDGRRLHIAFRLETRVLNRSSRQDSIGSPICEVSEDWKNMWKNRFEWELQTNPNFLISSMSNPGAAALAPRFLKVLVVVDKKFISYHKNHDPETYILTLMNMVSDYYHDATLGRTLEVVLVRIMYLEKEEEELDLTISRNAEKTLESFKVWAQRVNPADPFHPNHHDIAIMITRYDICSSNTSNCNILGIASVAAACQPERAACIIEDSGLMTGVTIAHEIGHVMGCAHDRKLRDGDDGCEPFAPDGSAYVMSMFLKPRTSIWSNCSRRFMETLIDTGMADCLLDEPDAHPFQFPQMPPGAMYDADYQCRDLLGAKEACPSKKDEMCKLLWCKIDARSCAAPGRPAADGTKCGEGYWCYGGECVKVGRRPAAVDGHWGSWSPWSTCSRTCGGGIQRSERFCNNPPPRNRGRYCVGEHHRYRVCNRPPCDPTEPTFREVQCSTFNDKPFEGQLYSWTPYKELLGRECELLCYSGFDFYVSLAPLVKDGTPCRRGTRNMCVSGQCMHVGCDWVLGSEIEEDVCGECGGDGTHCRLIKMLYDKPNGNRYAKIGTVPVDSRHVKIEEVKPTVNTIAVANKRGTKFFINGNYTEYANGEYSFGKNVRGIYSHPEPEREVLTIKGPTTEELLVYIVFYGGHNPGVRISYFEHIVSGRMRKARFEWEFLEWGPCSARCGGGSQIAVASCVEEIAGKVSASFCDPTNRPKARSRVCNRRKCSVNWHVGPWGICSGRLWGLQRRKVECRADSPSVKGESVLVENSECVGARPADTRPCPKSVAKGVRRTTIHHTSTRHAKTRRTPTDNSDHTHATSKSSSEVTGEQSMLTTSNKLSTAEHHKKATIADEQFTVEHSTRASNGHSFYDEENSKEDHRGQTDSRKHLSTGSKIYMRSRTTSGFSQLTSDHTSFGPGKSTTIEFEKEAIDDQMKDVTSIQKYVITDDRKLLVNDPKKNSAIEIEEHSTIDTRWHSIPEHKKHPATDWKKHPLGGNIVNYKKHASSYHSKLSTTEKYNHQTSETVFHPITLHQSYHSSSVSSRSSTVGHSSELGLTNHLHDANSNYLSTSVTGHSQNLAIHHSKSFTTGHGKVSKSSYSSVYPHQTTTYELNEKLNTENHMADETGRDNNVGNLKYKFEGNFQSIISTEDPDVTSSASITEIDNDFLMDDIEDINEIDAYRKICDLNNNLRLPRDARETVNNSTETSSSTSSFDAVDSRPEFVIDRIPDSLLVFKEAPLIGSTCNKSLSERTEQEMGECLSDTLDTSHGQIFTGKEAVERAKEIKKHLEKEHH